VSRRYTGAEARELKAKATKGPYKAAVSQRVWYITNADDEFVADTHSDTAQGEAVADLLAAAPDLAESLTAVEAERDALRECARLQRRALVLLDTIESHWAENDEESVRHTSRFYEEARSALSEWEDANPALLAALREASA